MIKLKLNKQIENQLSKKIESLKYILKYPNIYLANYFKDLRYEVDEKIIAKQIIKPIKTSDEKISSNLLNAVWKEMIHKIDSFEMQCQNSSISNWDEITLRINAIERVLSEESESNLEKIEKEIETIEKTMLEQLFQNKTITLVNSINLNVNEIIDFKLLIINDEFIRDASARLK